MFEECIRHECNDAQDPQCVEACEQRYRECVGP
jgi:hypothetical protein